VPGESLDRRPGPEGVPGGGGNFLRAGVGALPGHGPREGRHDGLPHRDLGV